MATRSPPLGVVPDGPRPSRDPLGYPQATRPVQSRVGPGSDGRGDIERRREQGRSYAIAAPLETSAKVFAYPRRCLIASAAKQSTAVGSARSAPDCRALLTQGSQ